LALTLNVAFLSGELSITGDSANDAIEISSAEDSGNYYVRVNGQDVGAGVLASDVTSIVVDGGSGNDTVTFSGADASTFTALSSTSFSGGDGDDTFNLGGASTGNLTGLSGTITIAGGNDTDTLNVNDQNYGTAGTYTVTSTTVARGSVGLTYDSAVEIFALNAGSAGDTIFVDSTRSGAITRVDGGPSGDSFRIGQGVVSSSQQSLGPIQGTLELFGGGSSSDSLNVYDQFNTGATYEISTDGSWGVLKRAGTTVFKYQQANWIGLGASMSEGNTINVLGLASKAWVTGGNSADTFNIGNAGSISGINTSALSDLLIQGRGGSDVLNINDGSHSTAGTYTVTSTTVARGSLGLTYNSEVEIVALNAGSGNDTINVNSTLATTTTQINDGLGSDYIEVAIASHSLTAIAGPLEMTGGGGNDKVRFRDGAGSAGATYNFTSDATWGYLTRNGISNSFKYKSVKVDITTSSGGTINLLSTNNSHGVYGNTGVETLNVGGTNGLSDIVGDVIVYLGGGTDYLNINDQNYGTSSDYTITDANVSRTGSPTIVYNSVENLALNAGSGNDRIYVDSTLASTTTRINDGLGNDYIEVTASSHQLSLIAGPLELTGGGGYDKVRFFDYAGSLGATYDFTTDATWSYLTRSGIGNSFKYKSTDAADLGASSGSTVNLQSTKHTHGVYGTSGVQTVNIGGAGGLSSIVGNVLVYLGGGTDYLNINDQNYGTSSNYTITDANVSRTGSPTIVYNSVENLELNAGSGNDTINLVSTSSGTTSVLGGAGNDVISLGSGGSIAALLGTIGIDAGAGDDEFNLEATAGAGLAAGLSGGDGDDTYRFTTSSATSVAFPNLWVDAQTGFDSVVLSGKGLTDFGNPFGAMTSVEVEEEEEIFSGYTISIGDATAINEGDSGTTSMTFPVTLTGPGDGEPVNVVFRTVNGSAIQGSDFLYTTGVLSFGGASTFTLPTGGGSSIGSITVPVVGDIFVEADESFQVELLNPSSNAQITADVGNGTILNDDVTPTLAVEIDADSQNEPEKDDARPCGCQKKPVETSQATSGKNNVDLKEGGAVIEGPHGVNANTLNNPHPIVSARFVMPPSGGLPDMIKAELTLSLGANSYPQAPVYYSTSGLSNGEEVRVALMADATSLDTGHYTTSVKITAYSSGVEIASETATSTYDIVNRTDSPYGRGRWLDFVDQLYFQSGGILLVRGDNSAAWFEESGGSYITPDGSFGELTEVATNFEYTDSEGNQTRFFSNGRMHFRQDQNGNGLESFIFSDSNSDGEYELTSFVDELNRTTTLAYSSGKLTSITDFAGRVTSYNINGSNLLQSITRPDPDGAGPLAAPVTSFTYYVNGMLESINEPDSRTTAYVYDVARRVNEIQNDDSTTWSFIAAKAQGVVDLTTTGYDASHLASATYLTMPFEAVETNERGDVVRTEVDKFGRPIKITTEITTLIDEVQIIERDPDGSAIRWIDPDPDGAGPLGAPETSYVYDTNGNRSTIVYPDGTSEYSEYDATYSQVTRHVDRLGRITISTVDSNGNTTSVVQVVGAEDSISGEADDLKTSYVYASTGYLNGQLTAMTDPLGRVTKYEYYSTGAAVGSRSQLQKITEAFGTSDASVVQFEYNAAGNLSAEIDPRLYRTEYVYDNLDRLITMKAADPAQIGSAAGPVTRYQYDGRDNATTIIDALGRSTIYTYDGMNRLVEIQEPDVDGLGTWTTVDTEYTYDATGNLASIIDPLGRVTAYEYDALHRVVQLTEPDPDGAGELTSPITRYVYDADGNLATMTDPLGHVTVFTYDIMGREISRVLADGAELITGYDDAGNVVMETDSLGQHTAYAYDDINRLIQVTDAVGAVTRYRYDRAGNLVSTVDALGRESLFTYDNLNRETNFIRPLADPSDLGYVRTIDDGDTGYTSAGSWSSSGGVTTYEGDHKTKSTVGSVSDHATWTFDDVTVGKAYMVLVHWNANAGGATGNYNVYDNSTLVSTTGVDQKSSSDDIVDAEGYGWKNLGAIVMTSGTLKVELKYTSPSGYLSADAVRVVEVTGVETTGYDAASNVIATSDGRGNVTSYVYDGLNRLASVTDPDPDGGGSLTAPVTKYQYDHVGNLTGVVDPRDTGNGFFTTRYAYDNLNRLTQTFEPVANTGVMPIVYLEDDEDKGSHDFDFSRSGSWSNEDDSVSIDDDYRLANAAPSNTAEWEWSALNNSNQYQLFVTWTPMADGTSTDAAQYTVTSNTTVVGTFTVDQRIAPSDFMDENGRLWKRLGLFTPTSGKLAITLSSATTQSGEKLVADGAAVVETGSVSSMAYSAASEIVSVTDPLGRVTSYVYDNLGRIAQVTEPDPDGGGSQTSPVTAYHYDANGNLTSMVDPRGNRTGYVYDELGRTTHVIDPLATGTPLAYFVDDDFSYFSKTGTWSSDASGTGGDSFQSTDPAATATWNLSSLATTGRTYEVLVNWPADEDAATDVVYELLDSSDNVLQSFNVNQQQAAADLVDGSSIGWKRLGVIDYAGGGLKIRLQNGTSEGSLIADAVQLLEVGQVSRIVYDVMGRVVTEINPLGNTTAYAYDPVGRLIAMTEPDPDGPSNPQAAPVTQYAYDPRGNLVSMTDPLGNHTSYLYDRLDRRIAVIEPLATGTPLSHYVDDDVTYFSKTGTWSSISNVATGEDLFVSTDASDTATWNLSSLVSDGHRYEVLVNWQAAAGAQRDAVYEVLNSSDTVLATFAVDQQAAAADWTDEAGRNWHRLGTIDYASGGLKVRLRSGGSDGTLIADGVRLWEVGAITQFVYDRAGNLIELVDPNGNDTDYVYDAMNRLASETTSPGTRSYVYDAASNLTSQFDRLGRERRFGYDRLGRQISESWYTSTTLNRQFTYTYDAAGQMTAANDNLAAAADYTFAYDNLGRLITSTMTAGGMTAARKLESGYDENGNRTTFKGTIGTTKDFINTTAYDRLNRVADIQQTSQAGGSAVAAKRATLAYDKNSQLTELARYSDLAGTQLEVETTRGYDALQRITALDHSDGSTSLAGYTYAYDVASRLTALDFTNSAHNAEDAAFSYDRTGQLVGSDRSGTTSDESYGYDEAGNRETDGFVVDDDNQYSQVVIDGVTWNLLYDAEGNLTRRTIDGSTGHVYYHYDHRNRLVTIEGDSFNRSAFFSTNPQIPGAEPIYASFTYDMFDRRVTRSIDPDGRAWSVSNPNVNGGADPLETEHFVYDGQDIVLQFNGTGAMTHRYLHGPLVDQVLADERFSPTTAGQQPSSAGAVLYPLTDQQNTVRDLLDTSGTVVNHLTYDSFGKVTAETNAAVDYLFGYAGMERDEAINLHRADHRYYDAGIQRWLSEDPIGFAGGDHNLYRYVGNGPTNATDPSGLVEPYQIPLNVDFGAGQGSLINNMDALVQANLFGAGNYAGRLLNDPKFRAQETMNEGLRNGTFIIPVEADSGFLFGRGGEIAAWMFAGKIKLAPKGRTAKNSSSPAPSKPAPAVPKNQDACLPGTGPDEIAVDPLNQLGTKRYAKGPPAASKPGAYQNSGGKVFPTAKNTGLSGDALRREQQKFFERGLAEGKDPAYLRGQAVEAGASKRIGGWGRPNDSLVDSELEAALKRAIEGLEEK
jgi:RHS repeat-associated protein